VATSEEFVRACLAQKGDRYVFAAETSPLDPNPSEWDCSELTQWASQRIRLNPPLPDGAYYQWKHSARTTVDQAIRTRGALLFIGDGSGVGRDAITHVAVSLGDGTTIEARGSRWGVGCWGAAGRFNFGAKVPNLRYVAASPPPPVNQGGGVGIQPGSSTQAVTFLQNMLNIVRGGQSPKKKPIAVDGVYGNETKAAVAEFQEDWNSVPAFTRLAPGKLPVTGGADPKTCDALGISVRLVLR
jgi:cell wall-associated NlpC family hydrolase